jgi:TonB family protein
VDTWFAAWEQNRLLLAYTRLRRRFSGPPIPGMPHTTNLDPFLILSVGLHLLVALLIYLLATRAFALSERPPINVRILETKAQATAAMREQKPIRQERKRKVQKSPPKQPPAKAVRQKPPARATPPKPVEKPTFTPKSIPRVARVQPDPVNNPIPKTLPAEAIARTSSAPSANVLRTDKGLTPMPVKPFEAAPPPATAPTETPRSVADPPAAVPGAAPTAVPQVYASTATAEPNPQPTVPTELSKTTLEGFQQPTGPVVVPERFQRGGRPQASSGAAVELIDTSDPDFTEYFEFIKRRVYASWRYPKGVNGVHKVSVRFTLDRAGAGHDVQVVRSTNRALNASAVQAMHRASPFPPIPEKFRALVGQPLTLIFTMTVQ